MAEPFLGEIRLIAFTYAPKGWAECNGQLLPINQNQALFALLGTQFGGNGTTTFALPDARGRTLVGQGQGTGLSLYTIGESIGKEGESLQATQLPPHAHAFHVSAAVASSSDPTTGTFSKPNVNPRLQTLYGSGPAATASGAMIAPAGSGQPHENRQPFLTLIYAIALVGIFPSRP